MKIVSVVGARPNFMKIAPLMEEMKKHPDIETILVHTGQHYDTAMSRSFFEDLAIPAPDINLEVGPASHTFQIASIMQRFEQVLVREHPELVIVVGDVNSTIACALTSVKLAVPVAHVEAGLRSFDRTMPEEVNRVLTDAITDFLFTTESAATENLLREGIAKEKIYFVGNVMIDTLRQHEQTARQSDILLRLGLKEKSYGLVTLHRPGNVDNDNVFKGILDGLRDISKRIPLIFPCHPRTQSRMASHCFGNFIADDGETMGPSAIRVCEPLRYLDFLKLMAEAKLVLTDSGGIQEETTILGVPCLTLRENTERPVTVSQGTNVVVGTSPRKIVTQCLRVLEGRVINGKIPSLWDGKAASRIVRVLLSKLRK